MNEFFAIVERKGGPVDDAVFRSLVRTLNVADEGHLRVYRAPGVIMTCAKHPPDARAGQPGSRTGYHDNPPIVANARLDSNTPSGAPRPVTAHPPSGRDGLDDERIILDAYRRHGPAGTSRMTGEFAFAMWDPDKRRLFCARDRFGCEPLYYARTGHSLLVANRLRCMLAHPEIARRPNPTAIGGFLLFGDHAWHDKSITAFEQVSALPPAHGLVFEDDALTQHRYWTFPLHVERAATRDEADIVAMFNDRLETSVARRVRGEPAVVALSGGMDSSAITAAMCSTIGATAMDTGRPRAVTTYYDRVHPNDEIRYTLRVAAHLDVELDTIGADDYPMLEPNVATTRPLEIYNASAWLDMYRRAARHANIILEGEAADSLLHYSPVGTPRGIGEWIRRVIDARRLAALYGRAPSLGTGIMSRLRGERTNPNRTRAVPYPRWLMTSFEERAGLRAMWRDRLEPSSRVLNPTHPRVHEQLVDAEWSVNDVYLDPPFRLPQIRDPYLDIELLELVLSLPPLPWLFNKHVLRRAMAERLPPAIVQRRKTPLGAIHRALLSMPSSAWIHEWRPGETVREYVDARRLSTDFENLDDVDAYVNLRPLLLERWMIAVGMTT